MPQIFTKREKPILLEPIRAQQKYICFHDQFTTKIDQQKNMEKHCQVLHTNTVLVQNISKILRNPRKNRIFIRKSLEILVKTELSYENPWKSS